VARWQHILNPLQKRIGCGCSLTVNSAERLHEAGFYIHELKTYYVERAPKFIGHIYEGVARKRSLAGTHIEADH
jgi:hypothetical protein